MNTELVLQLLHQMLEVEEASDWLKVFPPGLTFGMGV
jgi:hypothetical protein